MSNLNYLFFPNQHKFYVRTTKIITWNLIDKNFKKPVVKQIIIVLWIFKKTFNSRGLILIYYCLQSLY